MRLFGSQYGERGRRCRCRLGGFILGIEVNSTCVEKLPIPQRRGVANQLGSISGRVLIDFDILVKKGWLSGESNSLQASGKPFQSNGINSPRSPT
jgi:hypothetical protein